MAVEYVNKKGVKYFLKSSVTKTGKTKYNFVKTVKDEDAVEKIPKGYEIAENLTGLVSLRKKLAVLITNKELTLVKKRLAKKDVKEASEVERKGKYLFIHEAHGVNIAGLMGMNDVSDFLKNLGIMPANNEVVKEDYDYEKVFRLTLDDKETRCFTLERWCYRGSVDDWIYLQSGSLEELCDYAFPHIGQDSFCDLM